MLKRHAILVLGLALAAVTASDASALHGPPLPAESGESPAVLIVYGNFDRWHVAVRTLAGQRLSVPASVRRSPLGLSPDGRWVAQIPGWVPLVTDLSGEGAVEVAPVNGGSTRLALAGIGVAYAWSPDSQRLAASASQRTGPTLLRLFNPNTGGTRSFELPRSHLTRERAFFRILSWSPDGSRLLLEESNPYLPVAIVALDLHSGGLRTLARFGHKDEPSVVWSPDGRYIALAEGEGFVARDYLFAVIDVTTGRPLMQCSGVHHCAWVPAWPLVWAHEGRHLFVRSRRGIERLELSWQRSLAVPVPRDNLVTRLTVTEHGLVYNVLVLTPDMATGDWITYTDTLYFHDFATHTRQQLFELRGNNQEIAAIRPFTSLR